MTYTSLVPCASFYNSFFNVIKNRKILSRDILISNFDRTESYQSVLFWHQKLYEQIFTSLKTESIKSDQSLFFDTKNCTNKFLLCVFDKKWLLKSRFSKTLWKKVNWTID